MPEPWGGSFDFFISHRGGPGARHAAEVRQALESAGLRVASQDPDITHGDNFLARIHEFLEQARDLIVILTSDYDASRYTLLELTSFLATAAQVGESRRLLVVRVEDCRPPGLLAPFNYLDLVPIASAESRRALILAAARNEPRVDFTRARRSVDAALRHRLVRDLEAEAALLASRMGDAAHDRLISLDAHAAGVTSDFGASIREFIALYVGATGTDDIFGGRERELAELTTWLTTAAAPPYRLITATAGRGKSMLVVRWALEAVADRDLDVVLIPISIRCQTNTATVVLQALVSRLALLHEQETPVLTGTVPEVLCDLVRGYLQKERSAGRRTLVILDGLDEAVNREIFRGLLPSSPPPSLRILLTARSTSLGAAGDEWQAQLGFGVTAPRTRRELLQLQHLDRLDGATIAATAAEALAGVVDDAVLAPVAAELLRLSEGEPFVLKLYLQRIVEAGGANGDAIVEQLRHLEPGLHACFADWWEQQSALWKKQGIAEDAVASVLCALSAARGPMTMSDLQEVGQPRPPGTAIKKAIGHLVRFLVTSRGERVAIFHDRLAEFVRTSLMSAADLAALRRRFIEWGLEVVSRASRSSRTLPQPVPEYVMRYLGSHLHGEDVDLDRLTPLLTHRWADAWLDLEGNLAGFIGDVTMVLERATVRYQCAMDPAERSRAFLTCVEAVVARGSAISVAEAIPASLLPLLLEEHVWTDAQMLAYVRTIRTGEKKSAALRAIAHAIQPDRHQAFIEIAWEIRDRRSACDALTSIAPRVSGATGTTYVDIAAGFRESGDRARLLSALNTASNVALRQRVLQVLDESRQPGLQNHQLAQLAIARLPWVDPETWQITFDEAVENAHRIAPQEGLPFSGMGPFLKVAILCELASLAGDEMRSTQLARDALAALQSWADEAAKDRHDATLLRPSAMISAEALARWVFPEAWAAAQHVEAKGYMTAFRNEAMRSLAGSFDSVRWPAFADEVAAFVHSILARRPVEPYEMYFDVHKIMSQLTSDLFQAFEARIDDCPEHDEYRWRAEVLRLRRLPPEKQHALARRIFSRCTEISTSSWSVGVRAEAASFLPATQRRSAVQATLLASRSIRDDYSCTISMQELCECLTDTWERLDDAALQLLLHPAGFPLAGRDLARRLTQRPIDAILDALQSQKIAEGHRLETLLAVAGAIRSEEMLSRYRSCAKANDDRDRVWLPAMFALLGVISSAAIDQQALHDWLMRLSVETEDGPGVRLPPTLNDTQVVFLADRVTDIRDGRARVFVGGRIASELVRRELWSWHLADIATQLRAEMRWNVLLLESTIQHCSDTEAIAILRAAHGHVTRPVFASILERVLEKTVTGPHLDELAGLVVMDLREQLATPPDDFFIPSFDLLEALCRHPISPRAVDELVELAQTGYQAHAVTLLRHVAPWMDATAMGDYISKARMLDTPSERIKALATAFARLPPSQRTELFGEMTEWIETRYCGDSSVHYLRMSEHCTVEPLEVSERVLAELVHSASFGPTSFVAEFLSILLSWRDSGRIAETACRMLIAKLLDSAMLNDRDHVLDMLAGMGPTLERLAGVSVADVMNRIACVVIEWP